MALIRGSIVLHRLIKGNVKDLQVSDSGPLWPSCLKYPMKIEKKIVSHRIYKSGWGAGVRRTSESPLDPPLALCGIYLGLYSLPKYLFAGIQNENGKTGMHDH